MGYGTSSEMERISRKEAESTSKKKTPKKTLRDLFQGVRRVRINKMNKKKKVNSKKK